MSLRERKSADEVERLRAACVAVERSSSGCGRSCGPATKNAPSTLASSTGCASGAPPGHPLILFGEHAADPHGTPGARRWRPAM